MSDTRPESEFPTIADLVTALSRLVDRGLGALPVQVVVVPDSTMQAIGRDAVGEMEKPALLIELDNDGPRMPVTLTSVDRWQGGGMNTRSQ